MARSPIFSSSRHKKLSHMKLKFRASRNPFRNRINMFHIKSLELVHWDYWQRVKNIHLDAKIITIAGQNGSGKTTLLDALRTLFVLDCSMGRTYKHYARHSGQQTAWLRAVVNKHPNGRQLSNRPFKASGLISDVEVTLFCQIQKNSGD